MSTGTLLPSPADRAGDEAALRQRLDQVGAQVEQLTALVLAEHAERERWRELMHELVPVAQGAMQLASDELEDLSQDVTVEDAVRFARTAARTLPQLEAMLVLLGSAGDLAHEVTSLSGAGMATLTDTLASAERRGYFEALRHAAAATDRVAMAVNDLHATPPAPPPSTFALVRRLRDPEVRRGLDVALALVKALGAVPPGSRTASPTQTTTQNPTEKE